MPRSSYIYAGLGVIFLASLIAAILLPFGDELRTLAGMPAVGALFIGLVQVLRDEAAYEKSLLLQVAQNSFSIGATSHMAIVAFDKHVAFCEEYVEELDKTISTLLRQGPTKGALDHSNKLYGIQKKHALWLTPELEVELERFEAPLRKIGANAHVAAEAPGAEGHSERVREMNAVFSEMVGLDGSEGKADSRERVVAKLRTVLGIEELTVMRETLVEQALKGVGHASKQGT